MCICLLEISLLVCGLMGSVVMAESVKVEILASGKYSLSNLEKEVSNQPHNSEKFPGNKCMWKD